MPGGEFGYSVAAGPGAILIGAKDATYAFSEDTSSAQAQRCPLTASVGDGYSIGLSADGTTALVGALGMGAACRFSWGGATWGSEQLLRESSDPSGSAGFGYSVCLSSDGSTATIGVRVWVSSTAPTFSRQDR